MINVSIKSGSTQIFSYKPPALLILENKQNIAPILCITTIISVNVI